MFTVVIRVAYAGRRTPAPTVRSALERKEGHMVNVGILARMESRPGKEDEVAAFLEGALPLVQEEPGTVTWYAIRIGPSEFGIFDTFEDDAGRQAHLSGKVAEALMARASELFVVPPEIRPVDVLASK
jgi:quinol monooxygenase YgiN